MINAVLTESDVIFINGEVEISFEYCCEQNIGFLPYKLKTPTLIYLMATSLKSLIFSIKLIPVISTILSLPIFNQFLAEKSFFKSSA